MSLKVLSYLFFPRLLQTDTVHLAQSDIPSLATVIVVGAHSSIITYQNEFLFAEISRTRYAQADLYLLISSPSIPNSLSIYFLRNSIKNNSYISINCCFNWRHSISKRNRLKKSHDECLRSTKKSFIRCEVLKKQAFDNSFTIVYFFFTEKHFFFSCFVVSFLPN